MDMICFAKQSEGQQRTGDHGGVASCGTPMGVVKPASQSNCDHRNAGRIIRKIDREPARVYQLQRKAHQERVKHNGVLVVTIYRKHHFMTRAASQLAIPTKGMHRMDRCTDVARLIHVILKQYLNMIEYKVIMIFFFLILPFFSLWCCQATVYLEFLPKLLFSCQY